jgi:hypothetical protein
MEPNVVMVIKDTKEFVTKMVVILTPGEWETKHSLALVTLFSIQPNP